MASTKKWALIAAGLFAAVFFVVTPHRALAFTAAGQTDDTATSTMKALNGSGQYFSQTLGTGLSGNLTGMEIETATDAGTLAGHAALYVCNTNTHIFTSCTSQVASISFTADTTPTKYSGTFGAVTLDPTKYYLLIIYNSTGNYSMSGSAGNLYAGGDCQSVASGSPTACVNISDIYFVLTSNVGVGIIFPAAASYNGDFNSFWLSYDTAVAGETTFRVYYATSSANLNSSATRWENSNGLSIGGAVTAGTIPVVKTQALQPGGTYYARAQLEQTSVNIATSTEVSFQIAGSGTIDSFSSFLPTSAPTSTSTALTVTCDPDSNFFANSFCKLFQYLFVPDPAIWDNFKGLQTDLASKPPFGYVQSISTAFGGLVSSSTPTTSGFNVLSGVSTIFTGLKTLLSWVLWLIFGFWVFNKFRNFHF